MNRLCYPRRVPFLYNLTPISETARAPPRPPPHASTEPTDHPRGRTSELVVVQEEVPQGGELPQLGRNGAGEMVVAQAESPQAGEVAQLRNDVTCRPEGKKNT